MSDNSQLVPDAECHTLIKERTFNFKWIIHNLRLIDKKDDEYISSSSFDFFIKDGLRLDGQLKLYQKDYVYINIILKCSEVINTTTKTPWKANVRLSLLNAEGNEAVIKHVKFEGQNNSGLSEFMISNENLYKKENNLLPDGNLTVLCQITSVVYTNLQQPKDIKYEMIESKLKNDLLRLFENKDNCDVTLIANGHEFRAHKCILTARSDFFAAMFEHQMMESQTNRVNLPDVDKKVLEEILHYIYTGNSPNIYDMVFELLPASDMYRLENLKWMCENELYRKLSKETAVKILILADLYRANELKDKTIKFINANAKTVIQSKEWQDMFKNYPHLITEVLQNAIN